MKILFVDDDEGVRISIPDFLKDLGHDVFATEDIELAMFMAGRFPFDALIIDFNMPVMNGIDLINALRNHESCSKCPAKVVLISDERPNNLPVNVKFFKKPFEIVDLEKILTEAG
ncbi:MAG: response regulator [Patescibacteria group bacterium]